MEFCFIVLCTHLRIIQKYLHIVLCQLQCFSILMLYFDFFRITELNMTIQALESEREKQEAEMERRHRQEMEREKDQERKWERQIEMERNFESVRHAVTTLVSLIENSKINCPYFSEA